MALGDSSYALGRFIVYMLINQWLVIFIICSSYYVHPFVHANVGNRA